MKKLFTLLFVSLLLSSCSTTKKSIFGTWELQKIEGDKDKGELKFQEGERIFLTLKKGEENKNSYSIKYFINRSQGGFSLEENNTLKVGIGMGTVAVSTNMEHNFMMIFSGELKYEFKGENLILVKGEENLFLKSHKEEEKK